MSAVFINGIRRISVDEVQELQQLKDKLFQGEMFVVLDEFDPEVQRYSELMGLYLDTIGDLPK